MHHHVRRQSQKSHATHALQLTHVNAIHYLQVPALLFSVTIYLTKKNHRYRLLKSIPSPTIKQTLQSLQVMLPHLRVLRHPPLRPLSATMPSVLQLPQMTSTLLLLSSQPFVSQLNKRSLRRSLRKYKTSNQISRNSKLLRQQYSCQCTTQNAGVTNVALKQES